MEAMLCKAAGRRCLGHTLHLRLAEAYESSLKLIHHHILHSTAKHSVFKTCFEHMPKMCYALPAVLSV